MKKAKMAAAFISAISVAACGGHTVPVSEAVEVVLRTDQDRGDLLAILRAHAKREKIFFRDNSTYMTEIEHGQLTIAVALYRPIDRDEYPEVQIDDTGHLANPWITFTDAWRPEEIPKAQPARARLVAELRKRWPDLREVPVLPSGGLPLWQDLGWTQTGYKVSAEAASRYELPANSSLVAKDFGAVDAGRRTTGGEFYCLGDASLGNLASDTFSHLRDLRKHYSYCRFDPHSTDLVLGELVKRGDAAGLFDAGIRADIRGDRPTALAYLKQAADKGYIRAKEGLNTVREGGDP